MKNPRRIAVALAGMLAFAGFTQNALAQEKAKPKVKKAAIFIFKRTAKVPEGQLKVLEDYLKAQVTDIGFQVLSRDVIIDSLDSVAGGKPKPDSLEAQLSKASSAMRLAQNMGANLILLATINSYTTETRNFKGNKLFPVPSKWHYHRLRLTYSLAFGADGAAVIGEKFMVERKIRETSGLKIEGDDLLDGLMERASEKLAEHITEAQKLLAPDMIPEVKGAQFVVNTKLVMPGGGPLVLPAIFIDGKRQKIEASVAADVILNGVSIGTAPGVLNAPVGLSTIKVARQGFKPWVRVIKIAPGLQLDLNLEMTPEGYAKWKEQIQFFQDLDTERKYVEADAERIRIEAEALKKHGFLFKVDTREGIRIQKKNIRKK